MLFKYFHLLFAFVHAFFIVWFKFPKATRERKLAYIQTWSTHVLRIMGIDVQINPTSNPLNVFKNYLLVANHVSWLDVLVIQAIQPSVFVAKSEVKHWPVVGSLASACGVVFVDRSSSNAARKMVDDVTSALHHGYCVAGFPEGTSSEGYTVSLFHANLFEAAIHHSIEIIPVALRYTHAYTGTMCLSVAFVGEMGFLTSLHRVLRCPDIQVHVHAGKAISPQGHSRRTLAHLSHRNVAMQLTALTI